MTLFSIVKVFDLEKIFFFENNVDIYYRKVVVATLFSLFTLPKTSLVVLVFFVDLVLADRRLLRLLPTKYISRESVSGFIFSKVFILLFYKFISLEIFDINLLDT